MANKQFDKWEAFKDQSKIRLRRGHIHSVRERGDPTGKVFILKERADREAYFNELNALKELNHPNIERLVDFNSDANPPYLVTEFYEGGNMKNLSFKGWLMSERLNFFSQLVSATEYMNKKGYSKGDHKPGNIFLKADRRTPVIGDFESAKQNSQPINIRPLCQQLFRRIVGKEFMKAIKRRIYILFDETGNVISADDTLLSIVDRHSDILPPFHEVDRKIKKAHREEIIITGTDGNTYRITESCDRLR